MLGSLAARSFAIFLQENNTLVVLTQDIVVDLVALSLHEMPGPTNGRHEIVSSDELGLRGAPSVQLVFGRTDDREAPCCFANT